MHGKKRSRRIKAINYHPPRGDIRNVERGKDAMARMIEESKRKDEEKREREQNGAD